MAGSGSKGWRWTEEQPGVIVVVVLILAFALLFPQDACRGRALVEHTEHPAPVRWGPPAASDSPIDEAQ